MAGHPAKHHEMNGDEPAARSLIDGGDVSRDAVLFTLGVLDLERALIEHLVQAGDIAGIAAANCSDVAGRKERELGLQANLPHQPDIQTCVEYGTLSVLATLCEILIARDVVDAESLIEAAKRKSEFWRAQGSAFRALPAEMMADALTVMAAVKRDVDQTLAASRSAVRSKRMQ